MNIVTKNEKGYYELLELIDYLAQIDNKVMLQVGSPELGDVNPEMVGVWLMFLQDKGLVHVLERPELPTVKGRPGSTKNGWFVLLVAPGFHAHVDEVYRYQSLTVESLSKAAFLAVLDTTYDLRQKMEFTTANTVAIPVVQAKIVFEELRSADEDYRHSALGFLKDYGAIDGFSKDRTQYSVSFQRRLFDRTYQKIMTRAVQEGYAQYRNDPELTAAISNESKRRQAAHAAKEQQPAPIQTIENDTTDRKDVSTSLTLQPENYNKVKGILHLSPYDKVIVARRGIAKKKDGSKYFECQLLECVFKTVNTQKTGVIFSRILGLHPSKIGIAEIRRVRNAVDAINAKSAAVNGPKNLLKIQTNKVFVNNSYL